MLTKDEAELYDRQIRLWGVNAQNRLRQSKVLMLGFNGLASEVAKTLVLAGIDSLTIVDNLPLQESDLHSNLFCRKESKFRTDFVEEKLKTLNPLVKVNIQNIPITSVKDEEFKNYDLVTVHSLVDIEQIKTINELCRKNHVKFYIALDFGYYGFMFNDLGSDFQFSREEYRKNDVIVKKTSENDGDKNGSDGVQELDESDDESLRPTKRRRVRSPVRHVEEEKYFKFEKLSYCPIEKILATSQDNNNNKRTSPVLHLSIGLLKYYDTYKKLPSDESDFVQLNDILTNMGVQDNIRKLDDDWHANIRGSLSPVCAVIGGVAGQDMIRTLSGKDVPVFNTFAFDGIKMTGVVQGIGTKCETENNVRDELLIEDDD